jgi:hypothetical protein
VSENVFLILFQLSGVGDYNRPTATSAYSKRQSKLDSNNRYYRPLASFAAKLMAMEGIDDGSMKLLQELAYQLRCEKRGNSPNYNS